MSQKIIASYTFDNLQGITEAAFAQGSKPTSGKIVNITGNAKVSEVVKFLNTQGRCESNIKSKSYDHE